MLTFTVFSSLSRVSSSGISLFCIDRVARLASSPPLVVEAGASLSSMSPAAWPFNSDSRTSFLSALCSAAYPMNCWVCASRLPCITGAVYLEAVLFQCVLHFRQQTDLVLVRVRSIRSFAFRLFCICKCEIIRNADAAGVLADSVEETATCLTTFTAAAHRG